MSSRHLGPHHMAILFSLCLLSLATWPVLLPLFPAGTSSLCWVPALYTQAFHITPLLKDFSPGEKKHATWSHFPSLLAADSCWLPHNWLHFCLNTDSQRNVIHTTLNTPWWGTVTEPVCPFSSVSMQGEGRDGSYPLQVLNNHNLWPIPHRWGI